MSNYNIVCLGEVLWDILPDRELPGGAPMNVAYHLQQLSQQVAMVSRVGADDHGERLLREMERKGLSTACIQQDSAHPTGRVYARMDTHNDMQYDIVYDVAWDHIAWQASLEKLLGSEGLQYMVYGSLLARHPVSRAALQQALRAGVQQVLDINLRAPYYSRDTLEWLMGSCHLLKLNLAELELISAWYGSQASHEACIRMLADRFDIDTVLVTLGSKGCIGYIQEQFYYQPGQPVEVADTIGSGDAFLAGFLACRINGCTPSYSLAYANALGALVASRPGGCPDYDPLEITAMIKERQTTLPGFDQ
ncbi:carbohydrate kinase family protein [Chitinophaga japonensis]|uniref:Fructokinase n=1 Tax=Chitinophaga japonensis TaxID=104662 RepID=A0A562SI22_CHIJA|nr:carbohydrate kinase [Chitinophaga japonensis]TWI80949.1 fructokinase [Chitinophaga japonensis]